MENVELMFLCYLVFILVKVYENMYSQDSIKSAITLVPETQLSPLNFLKIDCGPIFYMRRMTWLGTRVLVKFARPNQSTTWSTNLLLADLVFMGKLRHPEVLLLIGICQPDSVDRIMLVFESLDRTLYQCLHVEEETLQTSRKLDIGIHIIRAMEFIHNQQCIHCGLSSMAIFLSTLGAIKVANFQFMMKTSEAEKYLESPVSTHPNATVLFHWMSPELMMKSPPEFGSDIYSFFCIIWEMATGDVPWFNLEKDEIIKTVAEDGITLPLTGIDYPADIISIMDIGLSYDSRKRQKHFSQISDHFRHEKQAWSSLVNRIVRNKNQNYHGDSSATNSPPSQDLPGSPGVQQPGQDTLNFTTLQTRCNLGGVPGVSVGQSHSAPTLPLNRRQNVLGCKQMKTWTETPLSKHENTHDVRQHRPIKPASHQEQRSFTTHQQHNVCYSNVPGQLTCNNELVPQTKEKTMTSSNGSMTSQSESSLDSVVPHKGVKNLAEIFQQHYTQHKLRQAFLRGSLMPQSSCLNDESTKHTQDKLRQAVLKGSMIPHGRSPDLDISLTEASLDHNSLNQKPCFKEMIDKAINTTITSAEGEIQLSDDKAFVVSAEQNSAIHPQEFSGQSSHADNVCCDTNKKQDTWTALEMAEHVKQNTIDIKTSTPAKKTDRCLHSSLMDKHGSEINGAVAACNEMSQEQTTDSFWNVTSASDINSLEPVLPNTVLREQHLHFSVSSIMSDINTVENMFDIFQSKWSPMLHQPDFSGKVQISLHSQDTIHLKDTQQKLLFNVEEVEKKDKGGFANVKSGILDSTFTIQGATGVDVATTKSSRVDDGKEDEIEVESRINETLNDSCEFELQEFYIDDDFSNSVKFPDTNLETEQTESNIITMETKQIKSNSATRETKQMESNNPPMETKVIHSNSATMETQQTESNNPHMEAKHKESNIPLMEMKLSESNNAPIETKQTESNIEPIKTVPPRKYKSLGELIRESCFVRNKSQTEATANFNETSLTPQTERKIVQGRKDIGVNTVYLESTFSVEQCKLQKSGTKQNRDIGDMKSIETNSHFTVEEIRAKFQGSQDKMDICEINQDGFGVSKSTQKYILDQNRSTGFRNVNNQMENANQYKTYKDSFPLIKDFSYATDYDIGWGNNESDFGHVFACQTQQMANKLRQNRVTKDSAQATKRIGQKDKCQLKQSENVDGNYGMYFEDSQNLSHDNHPSNGRDFGLVNQNEDRGGIYQNDNSKNMHEMCRVSRTIKEPNYLQAKDVKNAQAAAERFQRAESCENVNDADCKMTQNRGRHISKDPYTSLAAYDTQKLGFSTERQSNCLKTCHGVKCGCVNPQRRKSVEQSWRNKKGGHLSSNSDTSDEDKWLKKKLKKTQEKIRRRKKRAFYVVSSDEEGKENEKIGRTLLSHEMVDSIAEDDQDHSSVEWSIPKELTEENLPSWYPRTSGHHKVDKRIDLRLSDSFDLKSSASQYSLQGEASITNTSDGVSCFSLMSAKGTKGNTLVKNDDLHQAAKENEDSELYQKRFKYRGIKKDGKNSLPCAMLSKISLQSILKHPSSYRKHDLDPQYARNKNMVPGPWSPVKTECSDALSIKSASDDNNLEDLHLQSIPKQNVKPSPKPRRRKGFIGTVDEFAVSRDIEEDKGPRHSRPKDSESLHGTQWHSTELKRDLPIASRRTRDRSASLGSSPVRQPAFSNATGDHCVTLEIRPVKASSKEKRASSFFGVHHFLIPRQAYPDGCQAKLNVQTSPTHPEQYSVTTVAEDPVTGKSETLMQETVIAQRLKSRLQFS